MTAEPPLKSRSSTFTIPDRIRVETAFSRFPIHRLTKKGRVSIDLQTLNDSGIGDFKWEVTYNTKHGQPGPLAYKVDTLVINRLLDQLGRPLPELIKIGSLSDVCRALATKDTGPNIANIKSAFLQNASAFINAKIRYKAKNGRERWGEIGYSRYSVVFTGDTLPDGTQADAVYLILNPPYRELLNHVETRPLDYDYLKQLAPGPQRFYELLSFQMYGAIANGRPRAKMLYSDYCKYAPQTRYPDFNHVKKQMYKLHVPHRESGYIAKIEYKETTDTEGNTNWEMFYTPGPKAFAEYQAFTNRRSEHPSLKPPGEPTVTVQHPKPTQASLDFSTTAPELLVEMTRRGIAEKKARELLSNLKPEQQVIDQLEYVDSLIARDRRGKLDNPPGLYVHYIRDNIVPPADFLSSRKASQPQQTKSTEHARQAQWEIEYNEYQSEEIQRYINDVMSREEYQRIFAQRCEENRRTFKQIPATQIDELTTRSIAAELKQSGHVPLLSFEEFYRKRSRSQSE